ncbi:hypothetical protein [Amycolatopsis sp. NBC_01480]|uniref:hypothetical protein n=1 Tax=Amycolatopsis sp. NBC_01480 TaxID=2903562 RepID=UPI002E2C6373|nr:hypothetical protein [Amycolatopsis sp. NBC_01480]
MEWTGNNLDDWQARWGSAWVEDGKLWFGPTVGPVEIGGGMVDGPAQAFFLDRTTFEAAYTRDAAPPAETGS